MKSKVYLNEEVKNKGKHSAAAETYFPCKIIRSDGKVDQALFTKGQLLVAINRAARNPEDMPEPTWLEKVSVWFWGK